MIKKTNSTQLATKQDVSKLATKVELKKTERVLREEFLRVEERFENKTDDLLNKHDKEVLLAKIDEIKTIAVNFVGRVKDIEDNNEVGAEHTRELRIDVDKHGKRITNLESARQAV